MEGGSSVAVVGAGLVGCSWALVFARAGLDVAVHDADAAARSRVRDRIAAWLGDLAAAGLLEDEAEACLARVRLCDRLDEAVRSAAYIQESVFERADVKAEVCRAIDGAMRPDAVVGSSSSGIPASRFTEGLARRNRFLIAHPVNPPHLIPVVELVPAPWTDADAVSAARALMERVGQSPVTVNREVEGFILNRLQGALLNEAFALYREGYAGLDDIDRTVRDGLGLRWSFMGPFETIDLNAPGGIADYAARLKDLYHSIAMQRTAPEPWPDEVVKRAETERRAALPATALTKRSAWRDERLAKLLAHRRGEG
jgi:L-gulonate 3-dehydrogenase